ncbi:MAG: hypothetical protein FWG03_08490 [Clostridiales bacterium]|nr:hypothetical protein [Clostridiales bacterium]
MKKTALPSPHGTKPGNSSPGFVKVTQGAKNGEWQKTGSRYWKEKQIDCICQLSSIVIYVSLINNDINGIKVSSINNGINGIKVSSINMEGLVW